MEAYPDHQNLFRNLHHTIARWDGRACYVQVPEVADDRRDIIIWQDDKTQTVKYTNDRFQITGLSIGYCNTPSGPVYVVRRCLRQWTEALPINVLTAVGPIGYTRPSLGSAGRHYMAAFLRSVDNDYPSKEEAFRLNTAFHKNFAFYKGVLYHRGRRIGNALSSSQVKIDDGINKVLYRRLLDKHGISYV